MWLLSIALAIPAQLQVHLPGGAPVVLAIDDGILVDPDPAGPTETLEGFVVPGLVDSHVHLTFWPVAEQLLDAGIVAAVDLAAPMTSLEGDPPLQLVASGPMLTAPGGYPTTSWGRDGYGRVVSTPEEARTAVDELHASGARVVKVPLDHGPVLDEPTLRAVVDQAHRHDVKVVAHAMSDASALRAARAGVDVLAHTPTERLSDATVAAWADRSVVSTLAAFGATDTAVDNLRRLHDAGTTVLYGTDLGNRRVAGVDPVELELLAEAGLTPSEVLASCTTVPAAVWGLPVGSFSAGAPASFVLLDRDPLVEPRALAQPQRVWIDGARR